MSQCAGEADGSTSSVTSHRVLVLGAGGFIGAMVVAALREAGCEVLRGLRADCDDCDVRIVDLAVPPSAEQAAAAMAGVDVLVNAAGILRETRTQGFDALHDRSLRVLVEAGMRQALRRVVQISALGDPRDGEFIASKHRFDDWLRAQPLSAVVLRPSVVYSSRGSYGGTSLLRALASLPVLPLPADGGGRFQPLAAEDLAELVVLAVEREVRGVFEVVGPEVLSLRDYLGRWRRWLRLSAPVAMRIPSALVGVAAGVGERLGRGPLSLTVWRMLQRGNIGSIDAPERMQHAFGRTPRSIDAVLEAHPSQVQDRWHAQLYLLGPLLQAAIILLFLLSAFSGFVTPATKIEAMSAGSALEGMQPVYLARIGGGLDLLLALALWLAARKRPVMLAMLMLVVAYTLVFGLILPAQWLDPLGGLAKNLVMLPALAVAWVLAERR